MPSTTQSAAELRGMSATDLAKVAEESLHQRLLEQAIFAHRKHGPLTEESLERLLQDPDCVRHKTRIVYEYGEMAPHQFAQPDLDPRSADGRGRILYIRPGLRSRPLDVAVAVAYMLPVVNYGEVVGDEGCLLYGATLLGLTTDEFYARVCALADSLGSEPRTRGTA